MNWTIKTAILAAALLAGVWGCDSTEPDDNLADETNIGFGLDAAFATKDAFEQALNKTGSAQGSDFSGSYTVVFHGGRFSSDCTPEFARRNDFYVDDSASDQEPNQRFSETAPDYQVNVSIVQDGGRLTLNADGDGPESPLTG
jgi:hypothetical protein